jgi:hypothetical protein
MRMAYLIMAHANRAGLEELLRALLPEGTADFAVVHADAGSQLWQELKRTGLNAGPRALLHPDPARVIWGHHSQVEAIHKLMEQALREGFDYAHSLSGVDWPVASRDRIAADIAAAPAQACFAEAVAGEQEDRMQDYRFDTRWLQIDPQRNRLAYAATWELRRMARLLGRVRGALGIERSRPLGTWHKGSCWWSLPEAAVRSTCQDLSGLIRSGRLRGTVCSDEHAVATSLARRWSGHLLPNRRFIDFPPGSSSPRVLTGADLPAIRASGAWFARKVDPALDDFYRALP